MAPPEALHPVRPNASLPRRKACLSLSAVSTPLEFLYHFRDLLRESGIRFAITSGMACVYYGLQQNTKDSDWIIEPADLPKLLALLERHERRVPPWRISYRQIFGAPLDARWMRAGWASAGRATYPFGPQRADRRSMWTSFVFHRASNQVRRSLTLWDSPVLTWWPG